MKTIKWLWSIAFAFVIVLFHATLTSFFVAPNSPWYIALNKSSILPSPTLITIGWGMTYVISIIIFTGLIYEHKNYRGISAMVLMGIMQIIWSAIFFGVHNLLGGLIIEILLLAVAIFSFRAVTGDRLWANGLFFIVVIWYCIMAIAGLNIHLLNG